MEIYPDKMDEQDKSGGGIQNQLKNSIILIKCEAVHPGRFGKYFLTRDAHNLDQITPKTSLYYIFVTFI